MTTCNRCQWHPDRDLTCERHDQRIPARLQLIWHAADKAHPLCIICGNSLTEHEPQVCDTCLAAVRGDIKLIVTMHAELPAYLGQPAGQSFGRRGGDQHALPGGTVMAMLGPGRHGGQARRLSKSDIARGVEGREHAIDNLPSDPPSVAWQLLSWAMDWSGILGEGYREGQPWLRPATVPALAGFLEVNGRWAANRHPAFDAFAAEMRSLRRALEDVTGRIRKPTKANADCMRCGHTLERKVNPDTGLEDDYVTCSGCREKLGPAEYASAVKVAAWSASRIDVEGEAYTTPEALGHHLGRSVHTLTAWAKRDGLCRWVLRGGVLFVHEGDAAVAHEERKTRRTA